MHLIVIAKEPAPGRAKTRLCPPCTREEAAAIATAALADTLETVCTVPGVDPVLVLDGEPGAWMPHGLATLPQRGRGLAERIAAAFDDVGGPSVLIGMDTPHVSVAQLSAACHRLSADGAGAVLGPATDGGWWAIGLHEPDPAVFEGVPMSTAGTLDAQRARLAQLGFGVGELDELRDVDTAADAAAVAAQVPGSRFAVAVAASSITERALTR